MPTLRRTGGAGGAAAKARIGATLGQTFRDVGSIVGGHLQRREEREAEEKKQATLGRIQDLQTESLQLDVQKKRAGVEQEQRWSEQARLFNQKLKALRIPDADKKTDEFDQTNLTPEQKQRVVDEVDNGMEGIIGDIAQDEEAQKQLRGNEKKIVDEYKREKGLTDTLAPGQKAPKKPRTAVFRPDDTGELAKVEEEKDPEEVLEAREIIDLLMREGAIDNPKLQKTLARAQKVIDDFEARKTKLEDVESQRDFLREQQQTGFENAKKLKAFDFVKAKTLKEMEQAAKKAELDPGRPNETTIHKGNKDIWDKLDNKYNKSIGEHKGAIANLDQLDALLDSATGAADIAAIFKFMKSLDPRSVVRESEFKLPEQAGGVFNKMLNVGEKALKGRRLNDVARQQIKDAGDTLRRFYREAIREANKRYTKLSNAAKIDPSLVIDEAILQGSTTADTENIVETKTTFNSEAEARKAGLKNGDQFYLPGTGLVELQ